MSSFAIPVIIALIATIIILFAGVFSMARGGEFDRKHSEHFMIARIWIQLLTVVLIVVAVLYAANTGGSYY